MLVDRDSASQKASLLMTSPPLRMPTPCQMRRFIEFFMNWTSPSAINVLTPPGWRLLLATFSDSQLQSGSELVL